MKRKRIKRIQEKWKSRKLCFIRMTERPSSKDASTYLLRLVGSVLLFALTFGLLYQIYMEENYAIYDTTLRFHVRADDDSATEQELKLRVRDVVLEEIRSVAEQAKSVEELGITIGNRLDEVTEVAISTLREYGSENEVKVYLTRERFPLRIYGNVVFPAGEYTALRVDIGEASGHNWWCAIYPELCYTAEDQSELSEKGESDMEESIPESERNIISGRKIRFRFKILEWFSK